MKNSTIQIYNFILNKTNLNKKEGSQVTTLSNQNLTNQRNPSCYEGIVTAPTPTPADTPLATKHYNQFYSYTQGQLL